MIIANDVSGQKTFGRDQNHVILLSHDKIEEWQPMNKLQIARKLAERISDYFQNKNKDVTQHAAE